jgi:hypothetical protein
MWTVSYSFRSMPLKHVPELLNPILSPPQCGPYKPVITAHSGTLSERSKNCLQFITAEGTRVKTSE